MKKTGKEKFINKVSDANEDTESGAETISGEDRNLEIKKTREFYEGLIPLGEILFGRWGYTVAVNPNVSSFAFDHKKRQVILSPNLDSRIETKLQKTFVFCHEIGHMVQLFQDPDQYIGTFEDATARGEQAASESGEEVGQIIERAWNRFYNAFLDIHSNSIVRERIPTLQTEEGKAETAALYESLMPGDLSQQPLAEQFLFGLLRSVMIPGAETQISEEVSRIIDSPVSYLGRNFPSAKEACRELIFSGELDLKGALFRIRKLFSTQYKKLLKMDLENNPDGLKKWVEDTEDDSDVIMGGNPSLEDIKNVAQEHKKTQESSSDKTKSIVDKMTEQEGNEAGLSSQDIERMKEIIRSVGDTYKSLVDIWERFFSISFDLDMVSESGYLSGQNISMDRLIRDLPSLLSMPGEARIFERKILKESKESIHPKKLSLYMVLDLSGSMSRERRDRVQESAYAIAKSLIQFKRKLAVEDEDLASRVAINLRIIGFGDSTEELLDLQPDEKESREINEETIDPRLWKAIFKIDNNLGGTNDSVPLSIVLEDVKKETALLDEDKETAVVIEITDGETSSHVESSEILDGLGKIKNVHCRGIQIGDGYVISENNSADIKSKGPMIFEPTGTFEKVWGNKGKNLPNIADLKKILTDLLAEVLRKD